MIALRLPFDFGPSTRPAEAGLALGHSSYMRLSLIMVTFSDPLEWTRGELNP